MTAAPCSTSLSAFPLEHVASHEGGHAVAYWVLGWRFVRVSLATDPPGVWPEVPDPRVVVPLGCSLLVSMAGSQADLVTRGLVMPDHSIIQLLTGRDLAADGCFDVLGPDGSVAIRPARYPAVKRGGDLHDLAAIIEAFGWPDGLILKIWRSSERFVSGCEPAILAVAEALTERRTMTFDETADVAGRAMSRPDAVPDWVAADDSWWP